MNAFSHRSFAVSTKAPAMPVVDLQAFRRPRVILKQPYSFPPSPFSHSRESGSLRDVIADIAAQHGTTFSAVMGPTRGTEAACRARVEAMIAIAELRRGWSINRIAGFFGRDHTTVLAAFKRAGYDHGRRRPPARDPAFLAARRERRRIWRETAAAAGRHPKASNCKLTADDVRAIRVRLADGHSQQSIAADFGVGRPTIQSICVGRFWAHVK